MTEFAPSYHVILCEGFEDQVFWSGWLEERMGCRDARARLDTYNRVVGKGHFHFLTERESSIVIKPYHGRANLSRAVRAESAVQETEPVRRLVINLDSDAEHEVGDGARDATEAFELEGALVSTVIWECPNDATVEGVPDKQTLERLVAASIQAAYPGRGASVERWLADEPQGGTGHKNYGLSYQAKWYAQFRSNEFYRAIWRDERVATELRSRLEATGAWDVVEALVAD